MIEKAIIGVAAAIVLTLLGCAGIFAAIFGGDSDSTTAIVSCESSVDLAASPSSWPAFKPWSSEQVTNAAAIIGTGADLGIPVRGWIIALATAMQESSLHNEGNLGTANNRDSLGLFQQRPSQGWGTEAQILDPVHASTAFYQHLTTVTNLQTLPLTQAAQAVQRSAYPGAYAKWEKPADDLLTAMSAVDPTATCLGDAAVLARADTWITSWNGGPVPYLSSGNPTTWFGGYRRDCSGYASMALGLPGPGMDTGQLAAHSTPINKASLQPGDLLINPAPGGAGHVVIFDHWANAAMTSYVGYEESGDNGTHHRTIPYPYFGTYRMSPYHFNATTA
jgi:hypothetical protein